MAYTKIINLATATTLLDDTSAHTVQFQPKLSAYPTGAITATQGTGDKSRYFASLDEDTHYYIYVDASIVGTVAPLNSLENLGA